MSYDDYVNHIAQKYRLAISIAVISTTPENMTLEDYIQQLRNSISEDRSDSDDIIISICSDDFHIDETDEVVVNIDENNGIDRNDGQMTVTNCKSDLVHHQNEIGSIHIADTPNFVDIHMNTDQDINIDDNHQTFNDKNVEIHQENESNDVEMINTDNLNESITILHNFDEGNANVGKMDEDEVQRNSLEDVMEMLRGIDDNVMTIEKAVLHTTQSQSSKDDGLQTRRSDRIDLTQCLTDIDATLCESLDTFPYIDMRRFNKEHVTDNNQDKNHNDDKNSKIVHSKSKDTEIMIDMKNSDNNKTKQSIKTSKEYDISSKIETKLTQHNTNTENLQKAETKTDTKIRNYRHTKEFKNIYKNVADIFDTNKNKAENTEPHSSKRTNRPEIAKDIPEPKDTIMYAIPEDFISNTHYSESQVNLITIEKKYIHGTNRNNGRQNNDSIKNKMKDKNDNDTVSQETQKNSLLINNNNEINVNQANITNTNNEQDRHENACTKRKIVHIDRDIFSQESQLTNSTTQSQDKPKQNVDSIVPEKANLSKFETFKNMLLTENCNNFDKGLENMEVDEMTDSQIDLIPFKVIEELNKVKMYLNRKEKKAMSGEGYSSDAGYKSDSQSKNSLKMSQSIGWLNQAAHSLFDYITDCPLVMTTQDITNEISLALGQLIDKLHEEEQYPTFLEELLDTVQLQLRVLYEYNDGENMMMKKDEIIQRIILLNKSIHIQKYTIEKITSILEIFQTDLSTNDSLYEIKKISQIENSCYVFHILEIVLQKYNRISQNLSQSTQNLSQSTQNLSQSTQNLSQCTQNSQEERVLKKSNIMDIWRKKWNPNYKEFSNEGSHEGKCVISSCRAVLNKLIVECIEGYSLVSYFALKCFNVMQP